MIFIWKGYGIFALILPLILGLMCEALYPSDRLQAIGWIIGGIILFNWGKKLHNPTENESILYDENGNGYRFKKHDDSLFFIPMEYCGLIWIICSIVYLMQQ